MEMNFFHVYSSAYATMVLLAETRTLPRTRSSASTGLESPSDIGVPFINRIRLSSGGNIIEDIEDWNKIYAFMLLNQSSGGYANNDGSASGFNHHQYQESLTGTNRNMSGGSEKYMVNVQAVGVPLRLGAVVNTPANGTKIKYCLPLMTGLFNLDKCTLLFPCKCLGSSFVPYWGAHV